MFSLKKYAPRVYHIEFDKRYDLCATFMRYQEFYESSNERFVNKSFTLAEFMLWYSNNVGSGEFTYCSDWAGFNLPLKIVNECHRKGIADPNMYDSFMWGIYKMIDVLEPDSYIIGTSKESDIIDHELTHAMYYVNEKYKDAVDTTILYTMTYHQPFYEKICGVLADEGYAPHVFNDEINAYLTEAENLFTQIEALEDEKGYKELQENLISLRKQYFE